MEWGIGVEHEYLIQDGKGNILPSHKILRDDWNVDFVAPVAHVTAPAGKDASDYEFYDALELSMKLYIFPVDPDEHLDKLMESRKNAKKVRQYIQKHKDTLKFPVDVYDGDMLVVPCCSTQIYMITVVPGTYEKDERSIIPLDADRVIETISALISIAKNKQAAAANESDSYDIDGQFIESRSTSFRNETVSSVIQQLRDSENKVLEIASSVVSKPQGLRIYPWSGYQQNTKKTQYAGSYHVWTTLPHDLRSHAGSLKTAIASRRETISQHAYLAHMLQWIQPLINSLFSGDPRALGRNDDKYSRSSMRYDLNPYSGYGTTSVSKMIDHQRPFNEPFMGWYVSEDDMKSGPRMLRRGDKKFPSFIYILGKRIPYEFCLSQSRSSVFEFINMASVVSNTERFKPGFGSDIRSMTCDTLSFPVKKGWSGKWLRVGDTLELRFMNNKGIISKDAPIDLSRWARKAVGFEFRAIDNMPDGTIEQLMRLIILLSASAIAKTSSTKRRSDYKYLEKNAASMSSEWNGSINDVMSFGSHAKLSKEYIKRLMKETNVKLPPSYYRDKKLEPTAFEILCAFSDALYSSYSHDETVLKMMGIKGDDGSISTPAPVFVNQNQKAWEAHYHAASSHVKRKVRASMKDRPYIEKMNEYIENK